MAKKNFIFFFVLVFAFIFVGCGNLNGSSSDDYSNVVPNADDEVRSCFNLVNEFRTGKEAYYLNEDNQTKTSLVGQLGTLSLDDDLCKAAQIRANEIVSKFSHTRPDGSSCFTVLTDCSISYSRCGENIAAGTRSSTGEVAFTQWKEDDEKYSDQGHRRNMLGDFTKIGIAYTYDENSRYKYYWAMVLTK